MISASPNKPTTTPIPAAAVVQGPAPRGEQRQQQEQHGPQAGCEASAVPAGASESAQRIVDAYTAALGRPVLARTRSALHGQAAELLAAGFPEQWLTDRARELAAHGWTDLAKHAEKSTVPLPGAKPAGNDLPPWCGKCGGEPLAERWREGDDGRAYRCPDCNPNAAPAPAVKPARGGYQPFQCPPASAYGLGFYGEPLPGPDTKVAGWFALADSLKTQDASAAGTDG
jgi:hypothetical protein